MNSYITQKYLYLLSSNVQHCHQSNIQLNACCFAIINLISKLNDLGSLENDLNRIQVGYRAF